jgi:hypothetical protein
MLSAVWARRIRAIALTHGCELATAPSKISGCGGLCPGAGIHHRAQRLVPGHRHPAAAGQQAEPVVQPRRDLLRRHGAQPGRGQLDGQRHAVERAADPGHGGRVGHGDLESGQDRAGALIQQPDRGEIAGGVGG